MGQYGQLLGVFGDEHSEDLITHDDFLSMSNEFIEDHFENSETEVV